MLPFLCSELKIENLPLCTTKGCLINTTDILWQKNPFIYPFEYCYDRVNKHKLLVDFET